MANTAPILSGASDKGRVGKRSHFLALCVNLENGTIVRPKLLLITNRKLHMDF